MNPREELHNRYLSDPAIIAINNQIAKLYSVAIPTFIMDKDGNVSTLYNDKGFSQALANAKQVLADYVAANYPEMVKECKTDLDSVKFQKIQGIYSELGDLTNAERLDIIINYCHTCGKSMDHICGCVEF